jgi:hypothetical protein
LPVVRPFLYVSRQDVETLRVASKSDPQNICLNGDLSLFAFLSDLMENETGFAK